LCFDSVSRTECFQSQEIEPSTPAIATIDGLLCSALRYIVLQCCGRSTNLFTAPFNGLPPVREGDRLDLGCVCSSTVLTCTSSTLPSTTTTDYLWAGLLPLFHYCLVALFLAHFQSLFPVSPDGHILADTITFLDTTLFTSIRSLHQQ